MKITKRQLKQIIAEEKALLHEGKRNPQLEDDVSYFITSGPADEAVKYLEELIAHSEAGGDVDWRSSMNSAEEKHTNLEYAKKRLEMLKKGSGIGHTHQFESARITKDQLKRIIKESMGSTGELIIAEKISQLIDEEMTIRIGEYWYDNYENIDAVHNILDNVKSTYRGT